MTAPAPQQPEEPIAQVALDDAAFSYDRLYSYRVPCPLRERLRAGIRVTVPFGRGNRLRIGMVPRCSGGPIEQPDGEKKVTLKPVQDILDDEPVLTDELMMMVHHLHDTTFCTWYDAVRAVLPGGLQIRLTEQYELAGIPQDAVLTETELALYRAAESADSPQKQREMLSGGNDPVKQKLLRSLAENGCLSVISDSRQRLSRVQTVTKYTPGDE